jgi:gluconate 5-dehydrogenase
MTASFSLEGRVALVTGSSRNLGFEIARGFAEAGATVYVNGTNESRLQAAIEQLAGLGLAAHAALFDVSNEVLAAEKLDRIFAENGRLDILVNNVGIRMREPLDKISSTELRHMLDIDLVSAFTLSKLAAPLMEKGGYGRIINMGSIGGERGRKGDAAYIIVKGGMSAMTKSLCAELGPIGITVNTILPGGFLTEGNENLRGDTMRQMFKARLPLGRAGDPPEIAGAAIFLASPASSYVTGISLPVDGGSLATG